MKNEPVIIEVISGFFADDCIVINNYRVAGPKPWSGGRVLKQWECSVEDILRAVPGIKREEN